MLNAVSDRIFVRLKEAPKKSSLILTDSLKEISNQGIVESVGPLVCFIKKGQEVLFHCFDELPTPEKGVVVIRESSILGIYENE